MKSEDEPDTTWKVTISDKRKTEKEPSTALKKAKNSSTSRSIREDILPVPATSLDDGGEASENIQEQVLTVCTPLDVEEIIFVDANVAIESEITNQTQGSRVENTKKQRTCNWVDSLVDMASDVDFENSLSDDDDEEEVLTLSSEDDVDESVLGVDSKIYMCEWHDCKFKAKKEVDYFLHVSKHQPITETRNREEKRKKVKVFLCLWDSCGFDSEDGKEVMRHINYHAYHTKLKTVGIRIKQSLKLPKCTLDYEGRNLLPVIDHPYVCQWQECKHITNNIRWFFHHVKSHVIQYPRGCRLKNYNCLWRDCKKAFKTYTKLRYHLRSHTQEKVAGCPTCGGMFADNTKFQQHCQRQKSVKSFKCPICFNYYATEALLKNHFNCHINKYKCPFCTMAFNWPSSLSNHIRYKHISDKVFQCNFCEHRSVTQRALEAHQRVHCSENFWVCDKEGCEFSCRSSFGLNYHKRTIHGKKWEKKAYCCHICKAKFRLGCLLTSHLKSEHDMQEASPGTKFKYRKTENGLYKLQTVRYESLNSTTFSVNEAIPIMDEKKIKVIKKSESQVEVIDVDLTDPSKSQEVVGADDTDPGESQPEMVDEDDTDPGESQPEVVDEDDTDPVERHLEMVDEDDTDPSESHLEVIEEDECFQEEELNESLDSDFGDQLKQYLGLTGNSSYSVKVVKE